MVEHVVTHLVTKHGKNLVMGSFVHEIVVQRDAQCAQESGHIGGNSVGLSGSVDEIDVVGRNSVGSRRGEYFRAQGTGR